MHFKNYKRLWALWGSWPMSQLPRSIHDERTHSRRMQILNLSWASGRLERSYSDISNNNYLDIARVSAACEWHLEHWIHPSIRRPPWPHLRRTESWLNLCPCKTYFVVWTPMLRRLHFRHAKQAHAHICAIVYHRCKRNFLCVMSVKRFVCERFVLWPRWCVVVVVWQSIAKYAEMIRMRMWNYKPNTNENMLLWMVVIVVVVAVAKA